MSGDALHNLCLADPLWRERYEGWTELGHGASATVVRTHGKALGEDLALKVFPHLAREEWTRFRQEVGTAQRLTSPYIVRTYSPFPRSGFAWIELELVEGANLRQEIERRASEDRGFAVEEAVEVGRAVARALLSAHQAGVTHRDVKPANILLPRSGEPAAKLSDFGISRVAGAARLTSTGLLVGTPQFAAPEVIAGEVAGPPADVYAFTLCLYLMLSSGAPPFALEDEASPTHWLRAHTERRPRPIARVNPAVPPALAELIERGLSKEPHERPAAAQLVAGLEALRRPLVTAPLDASRAQAPARRWAMVGSVATAGLLAAAGGLALWARGGNEPTPRAAASPVAPSVATMAAALPTLSAAPRAPAALPRPSPVVTATRPPPPAPAAPPASPASETAVAAAPSPGPEAAPAPEPTPTQQAAAPAPASASPAAVLPREAGPAVTATPQLDDVLRARPVAIGRKEGLPGQREMTLVDALHGEEWIWFRFRLEGGASLRIARVSWEQGEITSYAQERAGSDLRVIVQVPRRAVTRRARLALEVDNGPVYTFALGSRSLGRFLKELFQ